jgi:DNA-binding NarL/FixJ family response regulator
MTIRVLLADDQAVVRDGLKVILDAQDDIDVVGEAADGAEVIQLVRTRRPDLVVMDIRMPRVDGIEATRRLGDDDPIAPRVLVLTTFGEDHYVYEALRAGASGFLLKDAQRAELIDAVRIVAAGERVLSPDVTRRVIEQFVQRRPPTSGTPAELVELTARELDVTRLVARGLSNAEIADELVVSPGTVKSHVAHILLKLGLRDRIQVVVLAYETGLVQPGDVTQPAG